MKEKDLSRQILSDIIIYMKYARYNKNKKRRETWEEIIDRYKKMMIKKYPKLKNKIEENCKYLYEKKVLPSARALQFGGKAIERNPVRNFNCSYMIMDHPASFKELMFILLSGSGAGISVQMHHIDRLPEIYKPKKTRRYLISDNIEGWAEAVGALFDSYMGDRKSKPDFDYEDIRPKGTPLKTSGGTSPGPADLKVCMVQIQNILDSKKDGEKLTSLEVLDICCYIASCVVSGGIRRSSMLALFSFDDEKVKACKTNDWLTQNPQRAMVNISAAILRHKIKKEEFDNYFEYMKNSSNGEPAIAWSNNSDMGYNPCVAKGSLVNTPYGFKKVEDIKKGDKIKTILGNEYVDSIEINKKLPVYNIIFANMISQNVTKNHIYYIKNKNKIEKRKVCDLKIGDKVILSSCMLQSKKLSKQEYNKYLLKGILLGDGCYTKKSLMYKNNIKICTNQDDLIYNKNIKKLCKFLGYTVNKNNKSKKWKSMSINISPAQQILTDLDLEKLYSYEKYISFKDINHIDKAFAILHGLLVTDGNINNKTKRPEIRFFTSSKKLAKDIVQLLLMCGLKSSITKDIYDNEGIINGRKILRKHIKYVIHLCGKSALDFANYLYPICIHDKKKKELKIFKSKIVGKNNKWWTKIVNIEANGYADVYDLYCKKTDTWITEGLVQAGCGEASLKPGQFCNLTSINTISIKDQKDFNQRAKVAAFFGTLQAGFTDFHLLREFWKETTEKDSLLGVSLAGIASGNILNLNIKEAAQEVLKENEKIANIIGINIASRTCLEKPDGTLSLLLSCSAGLHAWHAPYYIRRIRILKTEPIYLYLLKFFPELIEDDIMKPTIQAVFSIPIKAPDGAITRNETALQLLNRVKKLYKDWVLPGHRKGQNTHSISCTVTVKQHEWDRVREWMWENRDNYASITVFPYEDIKYPQLPFEEIDEQTYKKMYKKLKKIDLTKIIEEQDNTNLQGEVACAAGACEIQ